MKIVVLDASTLGDVSWRGFEELGELVLYPYTPREKVVERVKGADVVITNKVVLDGAVMDACPSLRLILVAATGVNNVDLEEARRRGIAVCNVAGYSTESVAQHTVAMCLCLLHGLCYLDGYVKSGRYSESPIFTHLGRPFWELKGKRWGIVGLGTIGRRVAELAVSFGCEVVYASTSGVKRPEPYPRLALEELMATSDVVSIHAPLNERTRGLIDYRLLSLMKPTSILLNLGRGGIVVEEDLARAIDEGRPYAAGLDVFEEEPISKESPLLRVKRREALLLTPHVAWTALEARQRLVDEMLLNLRAFLEGGFRNRVV